MMGAPAAATSPTSWFVACAVRERDGVEEVFVEAAVDAGATVMSVMKTEETVAPLALEGTVQVGVHEHVCLDAMGRLVVREGGEDASLRVAVAPGRVDLVATRPLAEGDALRVDARLTEWRVYARLPRAARATLAGRVAPHVAAVADRAARLPPAVVDACDPAPYCLGDGAGDGDQSALDRDRYGELERVWNGGGDFFKTPSPLSPFVQACAMGFCAEVKRVLGRLDADAAARLADARASCLRKAPLHAVVAGLRQTSAEGADFGAVATALLDARAPPDARDVMGRTPLFCLVATTNAAETDDQSQEKALDLLDLLVGRGADPNAEDRAGMVPLFGPAKENRVAVVTRLLQAGADATSKPFRFFAQSTMDATLAQVAACLKFDPTILDLLKRGAPKPYVGPTCAACGRRPTAAAPLKKCSRCKRAAYCSADCQKEAWPTHRRYCAAVVAPGRTTAA